MFIFTETVLSSLLACGINLGCVNDELGRVMEGDGRDILSGSLLKFYWRSTWGLELKWGNRTGSDNRFVSSVMDIV
jgi:hypothetical protein